MTVRPIRLEDRFDLTKDNLLLTGTQALVRLMLNQHARDKAAGHNTAGFVSGYRGSPLGAVDIQMQRAEKQLSEANVTFQLGLNEDLAATAHWGAQQAELRGEGKYDGVFGLWYGKGPGVDRSGDAMRHANMAGTSALGGVVMAMGDDHTGESSTVLHQSEWALVDAYMPIVSPAGVQEVLDYGAYAFALSRFAGVWVGLKTMKDTIEVTAVVDGAPDRMKIVTPDFDMPEGGLNIRVADTPHAQEARMIDYKRFAAEAFSHANKLDKRVWGRPGAKIGLVAAGKNWLDLTHAMSLLGLDAEESERLGITTYKVGQVWPLDMKGFHDWAEGLDLIVVVEEKRKLIEVQVKEAIFDDRRGRRVFGWYKDGEELFPTRGDLDPIRIADKLGEILVDEGRGTDAIKAGLDKIREAQKADNAEELASRLPYFCAGCPHNSSTKVPDGARAYAGIGCHYMVQWMDRDTVGFTHMGAEGANWIGESLFSNRPHVFQNLGDGTYNHSGIQAVRAAVATDTTITYKLLFNDAVAMTGGQGNDGGLDAPRIAAELVAVGVKELVVVYDDKEDIDAKAFPNGIEMVPRAQLNAVQERLKSVQGVTAILYIQTCAAEKRRRRKRGMFPDPDKRVFINKDICEGCGDCGVQSNCVAITPVETELGRKRAIDQSACNKDFSCLSGFCPSFVTLEGATVRKEDPKDFTLPDMPEPELPSIHGTHNIVITGVGGTGVVTIGAILAQAAQMDGKGAGMMEMAGLAQKGGAVLVHCRIGNSPDDISAIRVATGECDALIGGDLVVSAGAKTLGLTSLGRTGAVVNAHDIVTGDFTRDTEFRVPSDRLELALQARMKERVTLFDSTELSRVMLGDSIFSNMLVFGAAWQKGLIPISYEALQSAIRLNGTAVERNLRAFEIGRWAAEHPDEARGHLTESSVELPKTLDEKIAFRVDHLKKYQSGRLARKYRKFVDKSDDLEIREALAVGYHKVLAYKDEYEVGRLHRETRAQAKAVFDGDFKLKYHLAPPILSKDGPNGRPMKREFKAWFGGAMSLLARFKILRGSAFDPFGKTEERKMERALIVQYERDIDLLLPLVNDHTKAAFLELALLPTTIRGFGPVKLDNAAKAEKRREVLLALIRGREDHMQHAAE